MIDVGVEPSDPAVLRFKYLVKRYRAEALAQPSTFLSESWTIAWIMGGVIIGMVLLSIILVLPLESARQDAVYAELKATQEAEEAAELALIRQNLPAIRAVIDAKLKLLQAVGSGTLEPKQADFTPSANVREIRYSHCTSEEQFYVFVIEARPSLDPFLADSAAYAYTEGPSRYTCVPPRWEVTRVYDLEDNWHYVMLDTR